jgi:hypothetical protein
MQGKHQQLRKRQNWATLFNKDTSLIRVLQSFNCPSSSSLASVSTIRFMFNQRNLPTLRSRELIMIKNGSKRNRDITNCIYKG